MIDNQACDIGNRNCEPCQGAIPALSLKDAVDMMNELHNDWQLSLDGKEISRSFKFKGFARAVQMANLIAWVGDQQGHHPDIAFGWGYCSLKFTTHEISGLSTNDFICAAKLDQIVDNT